MSKWAVLSGVVCLVIATAAQAQSVRQVGSGVTVDFRDGCVVYFDARGRIARSDPSCNRDQVEIAKDEYARFERGGSGYQPGRPSQPGSSYLVVEGLGGGDLALLDRPSRRGQVVIRGIRDGERLRSFGCSYHEDDDWCEVEYRGKRGWARERFLVSGGRPGYDDGYRPGYDGDRYLTIEYASYGAGRRTCDITNVFRDRCDGLESCSVRINNDLCGDPASGVVKDAEIRYRCGRSSRTARVREGDTAYIDC